MTTLYHEDVTCRICDQSSEQTVIGSTNSFGSMDLDLRPPEMQRSTMPFWLQFCPHCGFAAPNLQNSEGERSIVESAPYREILADQKYPELARRFLAHALLHERSDIERAANAKLRAAWTCDDARLEDLAVECRLGVADLLTKLQPFADDDSGWTLGSLLVDILRRAGRFEWATWECESILGKPGLPEILDQILRFQLGQIGERDRDRHSVEEAIRPGTG